MPDRVAKEIEPGSFIGFVTIHLLLERFALTHTARESLGYTGLAAGLVRRAC